MSSGTAGSLADQLQALAFDVFGTVVDWRSSVEAELRSETEKKINSSDFHSIPAAVQQRAGGLTDQDYATFAQEWRNCYSKFTKSFVPGKSEWKDIDSHHYDSLVELLEKWGLTGLYNDDELRHLSEVWHRLKPWDDSPRGLHKLGERFTTATLSNGNQSLLKDLNKFGNLGFQKLISAADFEAYKPSPAVYLGAVNLLDLKPENVAMVAAHLGDLKAASSHGMRTIYVERSGEESWRPDENRYKTARDWVDLWVSRDEDGFIEVARRLGLP